MAVVKVSEMAMKSPCLKKVVFLKRNVPVSVNYIEINNISTLERARSVLGVIRNIFIVNISYLDFTRFSRRLLTSAL